MRQGAPGCVLVGILPRDLQEDENSFSLFRSFCLGPPKSEIGVTCVLACVCVSTAAARSLAYVPSSLCVCTRACASVCICALSEGHVRLLWRMAFEKVNMQKKDDMLLTVFSTGDPVAPTRFSPSCAHLADYLILHSNIIVRPVRTKKERGEREGKEEKRSVRRTDEGKERKREREAEMRKREKQWERGGGWEREKTHRECSFDQKHNFRDVIGGRACANWFRWFSMHGETRATDRSTPLMFPHSALHIAKKHAALSRRSNGTGFHRYRARFARATAAADIYPSTPTC